MRSNIVRLALFCITLYFSLVLMYGYMYSYIYDIRDMSVFDRSFKSVALIHFPLFFVLGWKVIRKEIIEPNSERR